MVNLQLSHLSDTCTLISILLFAGPVGCPQRDARGAERVNAEGTCRCVSLSAQRNVLVPLDAVAPGACVLYLCNRPAHCIHRPPLRQGEEDAGDNGQEYHADYCTYLVSDVAALIDFLRAGFPGASPATPFITGGLLPYWQHNVVGGVGEVPTALAAINTSRVCTAYGETSGVLHLIPARLVTPSLPQPRRRSRTSSLTGCPSATPTTGRASATTSSTSRPCRPWTWGRSTGPRVSPWLGVVGRGLFDSAPPPPPPALGALPLQTSVR